MWSWKKVIKKKYKRVYWVQSFIDSVFLLSSMAIFLWHKTMLSRFEVFPFVASPDSWLPSSVLASATSIPFFRNRISFSSSYTTSFVCLANSSFTLASFICSSTFLCCSRNAPYLSLALSHDLNKFCVTLLFSIPPLWMIKSLTSANMVSSLVEYPWMLNKLLLMGNPCFGSTFAWGKKNTHSKKPESMKTLLSLRIFHFWYLEWKPLLKGRFFIFTFCPLRSVFRHSKRNLV